MRVRPRRPICWNFWSFFAFIGSVKTLPKSKVGDTRFPYESGFGGEEVHARRLMEELDKRGIEAFFLGSCPILLREFKERGFWVKRAWLAKPPVALRWLILFSVLGPVLFLQAGLMLGRVRKR